MERVHRAHGALGDAGPCDEPACALNGRRRPERSPALQVTRIPAKLTETRLACRSCPRYQPLPVGLRLCDKAIRHCCASTSVARRNEGKTVSRRFSNLPHLPEGFDNQLLTPRWRLLASWCNYTTQTGVVKDEDQISLCSADHPLLPAYDRFHLPISDW